jgi:GAF domain-containing protein
MTAATATADAAPARPLLHTIVRSAVDATGAARGWLLAADGADLRVVAAHPYETTATLRGVRVPAGSGVAGYSVSSGQPLALSRRSDEALFVGGIEELLGPAPPASVVCVPCESDGNVVGALQIVDKPAGSFTFDDVEIVTLLGSIAGAALTEAVAGATAPVPAMLGRDLERLAATDPSRYGTVASIVEALLGHG